MPAQKRYSSNYQDEDDDESLYQPQQRRNQRRRGKQSRRRGGGGGGGAEQREAAEEELQQEQQRIQLETGEEVEPQVEQQAPNHDQESIKESSEDGYVFSKEYNTHPHPHPICLCVCVCLRICVHICTNLCVYVCLLSWECVFAFWFCFWFGNWFSRFDFQILMGVELILKTLTSKFFVLMPYMYTHLHARVILFSRCQFAVFLGSVVCFVRTLC